MNSLARQKLCEAIALYGLDLCDQPQRCEAVLNDLCGAHREEIGLLVTAAREGIASDLRISSSGVPHDLLLRKHIKNLQCFFFTETAARWGVESWALALGIISHAELSPTQSNISQEKKLSSVTSTTHQEKNSPPISYTIPQEEKVKHNNIPPLVYVFGALAALMLVIVVITLVLKSNAEQRATEALAAKETAEQKARDSKAAKEKTEQETKKIIEDEKKTRESAEAERKRLEMLLPSSNIESTWAEVGYYIITLHTKIEANNLQSVQCMAVAYLYDEYGNELWRWDKPITASTNFIPTTANTVYDDLKIYIYPRSLSLEEGNYSYKIVLKRMNGDIISESEVESFTYTIN